MRSSAGLARRPKDHSAADLEREAPGSGGLNYNILEGLPNRAIAERRAAASGVGPRGRLSDRLAALAELSPNDLRLEWRRLFRSDPPRLSRDIIFRATAYRLQEIAHGGPSKATQRRLATFAAEFDTGGTIAPLPGPRLKPGSRLVREWHGRTYMVSVTDEGFEFQGKSYRSLTEIARRLPALNGPGLDSLG